MKTEIPYTVIAKSFLEPLSSEEKQILTIFLAQNPENKKIVDELRFIANLSAQEENSFAPDTENALLKVTKTTQPNRIKKNYTFSRNAKLGIAIAAMFVLGIGFVVYNFYSATKPIFVQIKTNANQQKELILPDGSQITLAEKSFIEYPEKFEGKTRAIKFKGVGYFKIHKNKEKPFLINFKNNQVKVLGTAFCLKTNPENKNANVSVTEGLVQFSVGGQKIKVPAGKKAIYNPKTNKITLKQKFSENEMAWKTGILNFKDASITDFATEIAELYNVKIHVEISAQKINSLNGTYNKKNLKTIDDVFKILQTLYPELQISKTGNTYKLSLK